MIQPNQNKKGTVLSEGSRHYRGFQGAGALMGYPVWDTLEHDLQRRKKIRSREISLRMSNPCFFQAVDPAVPMYCGRSVSVCCG